MNQLIITNNTITYNHQVIKISNISSIDLRQTIVKNNVGLILLGIILAFGALASSNPKTLKGVLSLATFSTLSFLCFWVNNKRKKDNHYYFLMIHTNAGSQQLFSHKEYDFINAIRIKIQEALDAVGNVVNVSYNLDNKTVINNPTGNIVITSVTQYQGLSESDREYLKTFFEPALQKIQNEIAKGSSEEMKRNFEMLKQELKLAKPRKQILDMAWSVVGNLSTLSDIASIIEKGITMF